MTNEILLIFPQKSEILLLSLIEVKKSLKLL